MAHFKAYCSLGSLKGIRDFVRGQLVQYEILEPLANQLVLAVDEACANSIIHQHNCDGSYGFDIYMDFSHGALTVEIVDSGKPFPLHQYKPEELDDIIRNRTQGGLGIFLITRIMDKVEVEEKGGKAIYRFIKRV